MTIPAAIEIIEAEFGEMPQDGDLLPDGTFVSVEVHSGEVVGWSPDSGRHRLAATTSGPIAVILGTDGAAYLAHTGGRIGDFWLADDAVAPCVQRLELGASVARTILTEVNGEALVAPHDVDWGADGRLWIADSHVWEREPEKRAGAGRIIALGPDGTAEVVVDTGVAFPCGIVGEATGSIVWTETYTDRVQRWRPDGTVETVCQLPAGHMPHGIRVGADGSLYVAAFGSSTLDIIAPNGVLRSVELGPENRPTHLAFSGTSIYVVEFVEDGEDMSGRLLRVESEIAGAPVLRGRIDA